MNEKEIFQAAVELSDPAQRQAYLAKVCGGNAALRARVEALLAAHAAASSEFLNVPAMEQTPPTVSGQQPTLELPAGGGGTGDTPRPDHEDDESDGPANLSFLQPSTKPGSLGRLGHYEILQVLGQGAFGIVFKAFDEMLHRHVAIKVMSPELASTSPPRKRFLREARSVAALKHENIIQIYSVEEQPLPYLAMEFVDGQTLQQKLDGSGPLDFPEILHLGRQMAAGLAAAHDKGLIHRDIKPGNILIEAGAEQKVKITDFGLARAADDATMTRTGTIAGTPMYMAPEQALGQTLDHRADLFSLGSVLYQMTCGRPPFRGANAMAVLKRVIDETPRPIQDILPQAPDWLCAIIEKLHAKNPDERYQTAKEVADVLARCQNELQFNGHVTSVPVRHATPAVVAQFAAPADARLDASPSVTKTSSRRPLVAAVAAAILMIGGLSVTELTGITHLFRKPSHEIVPVAGSGAQPERNGGVIEPPLTADRRAAEWLLSIKAPFGVRNQAGVERYVQTAADMPAEPYVVSRIDLQQFVDAVTNDGLANARGLKSLKYLNLTGCRKVTDAGVAHLADCVALETVDLGFVAVTDRCVASLSKLVHLRHLGLGGTSVTDEGFHRVVREHPKLIFVSLPPGLTAAGLADLEQMKELDALVMLATYLTTANLPCFRRLDAVNDWTVGGVRDAEATVLAGWPQIERLTLHGNAITPRAIDELVKLPMLVHLSLGGSAGISDDHLNVIPQLSRLKELHVHGTSVTDVGLKHLHGMSNLTLIVLFQTKVTQTGVEELHKALPGCRIHWDGGVIEPTLTADRRAAEWLLSIKAGFHVRDQAGVDRVVQTAADLPAEPYVVLRAYLNGVADAVTDDGLANLRGLKELEYLNLSGCGKVTDAGVGYLADLTALKELLLGFVPVTDRCVGALDTLPNLRTADLGETGFSDEGFRRFVRGHPQLSLIHLPPAVTTSGLAELPNLKELTFLVMRAQLLTATHFPHLQRLKNVTTWGFSGARDSDVTNLSEFAQIESLILNVNAITPKAIGDLVKLPNLALLNLNGSPGVSDEHLKAIPHLTRLRELHANGTGVTDAGLKHLHAMSNLNMIVLTKTKVTKSGIDELHQALPGCKIYWDGGVIEPTLTADRRAAEWLLSIKAPIVVRDQAGVERGVQTAADLPAEPYVVVHANLQGVADAVTDDGLANLRGLKSLEVIVLCLCKKVTDAGIAHLADCDALTNIQLLFVPVTDGCVSALSRMSNLRIVWLGETGVTDAGLRQLVREHPKLTELSLPPDLTAAGLAELANLKELDSLGLRAVCLTAANFPYLQRLDGVKHWTFAGAGDAQTKVLAELSQVERLTLNVNEITPKAVDDLAKLRKLVSLNLNESPGVSDEHLKAVSQLSRLRDLVLNGTTVTDAGLKHLYGMTNLTLIYLQMTKVTRTGVEELHKALPGCRIYWDGGVIEPEAGQAK